MVLKISTFFGFAAGYLAANFIRNLNDSTLLIKQYRIFRSQTNRGAATIRSQKMSRPEKSTSTVCADAPVVTYQILQQSHRLETTLASLSLLPWQRECNTPNISSCTVPSIANASKIPIMQRKVRIISYQSI
mmetsp:Transcript_19890/g.41291  ORF Transcript_19890/g.41291 Transcript_19890/m.41291 type:complete len:132 (+) Transcript_19890:71-466(+)